MRRSEIIADYKAAGVEPPDFTDEPDEEPDPLNPPDDVDLEISRRLGK